MVDIVVDTVVEIVVEIVEIVVESVVDIVEIVMLIVGDTVVETVVTVDVGPLTNATVAVTLPSSAIMVPPCVPCVYSIHSVPVNAEPILLDGSLQLKSTVAFCAGPT